VNYANWEKGTDANPIAYNSLSSNLLRRIKESSSAVLARKFKAGSVDLSTWRRLVTPDWNNKEQGALIIENGACEKDNEVDNNSSIENTKVIDTVSRKRKLDIVDANNDEYVDVKARKVDI
jgi:PhoPQ-activated pathogenicity-related protein